MTITEQTCTCGTDAMTAPGEGDASAAPCTCGCCGTPAATKEEEIAELRRQLAAVDQRLSELERA